MSPWLFNVYMHDVVLEVNMLRCSGNGWNCCRRATGARFEINQLLFAHDTAL